MVSVRFPWKWASGEIENTTEYDAHDTADPAGVWLHSPVSGMYIRVEHARLEPNHWSQTRIPASDT